MHVSCDAPPRNPPTHQPEGTQGHAVDIVNPLALPAWDSLVARHSDATVFHTAAWARTLVETYGFVPSYLAQREKGELLALLPLMQAGSVPWRRRCIALPFTDNCPPLLATPPNDAPSDAPPAVLGTGGSLEEVALADPLLASALRLARSSGSRTLELRDCEVWTRTLTPSVVFRGHIVPLHASEEAQLERCSPSMRRALRKAGRSPLHLKEGRDLADVKVYYSLHCQTRRRHGLPPQPFAFFRNIHRHLVAKGLGFVLLAMDGTTAVAGAVFLGFGRNALYKFGASLETHLELRPNNLVLWQGIRRCAELGFSALDLGRTSLDNEGLRRFKLGLGGEERLIHYVRQDVRSGCIVVTPDRAQGWHNRVFRVLPLPISRAIGAVMYRFAA